MATHLFGILAFSISGSTVKKTSGAAFYNLNLVIFTVISDIRHHFLTCLGRFFMILEEMWTLCYLSVFIWLASPKWHEFAQKCHRVRLTVFDINNKRFKTCFLLPLWLAHLFCYSNNPWLLGCIVLFAFSIVSIVLYQNRPSFLSCETRKTCFANISCS